MTTASNVSRGAVGRPDDDRWPGPIDVDDRVAGANRVRPEALHDAVDIRIEPPVIVRHWSALPTPISPWLSRNRSR